MSSNPGRGARRGLIAVLALERSLVGMLAMVVLVGLGEKLAERYLPLYLVALGGGALSVGLLNGLDNLLSAFYALAGGRVADRWGVRRSLIAFNLLAMLGFALVVAIPAWPAVIAGAALFLSWTALSLPATMALVAQVLPAGRRTVGVSLHSLVRRVPMALGPLLGGLAIDRLGVETGVRVAFAVALALAGVAMALQLRLIRVRAPAALGRPVPGGLRALAGAMSGPLRDLLVADILVRFCEQIPYAFVVLWCLREIAHPVTAAQFGILTAIEMATALLIYLPVAHLVDRTRKKPFVVATFGFFTLFPVTLLFCTSFWPLVGAFVVRGLKEFAEPARKALILELSPAGRQAGMFGLYYLIRDVIVSVAAFGGALLWQLDPAANLLAASGFGLLGTLWFARRGAEG